jgi:hypothetical protein
MRARTDWPPMSGGAVLESFHATTNSASPFSPTSGVIDEFFWSRAVVVGMRKESP